jgi:DNA adenine methylase
MIRAAIISAMKNAMAKTNAADSTLLRAKSRQLIALKSSEYYRSPLRYPGGKQKALDSIAARFPKNVLEYREPLVGGGCVYLRARSLQLAEKYWINDKFKELISFWKTVQNHGSCDKLIADLSEMKSRFHCAEEIKKYFLKVRNEKTTDPYREAFLFFFFNRVTFSGTTRAGGFSSSASLRRFTDSSIERLAPMPEALKNTKITNCDFEDLITADGKDVFFFLDPPYYTATRLYGRGGSLHQFDHERLAKLLRNSNHRFLITYDDCEEIRSLFNWAKIEEWQLQYGMNNCNLRKESKVGSELFISNY